MKQCDIRDVDLTNTLNKGLAYVDINGATGIGGLITDCEFIGDVVVDYRPISSRDAGRPLSQDLRFSISGRAEVGITAYRLRSIFDFLREYLRTIKFSTDPNMWLLLPLPKNNPKVGEYVKIVRDTPRVAQMFVDNRPEPITAICPVLIEWDD